MERDKLSLTAVSFLKSEENVSLQILIHPQVYGKMFLSIILWIMADGIAKSGRCQNHFVLFVYIRQMLLPNLADVIAKFDRCYCQNIG